MDSSDFTLYISSRYGFWIGNIYYYNSEYWYNDNGAMYKISSKEISTQFPVCYLICREVLKNIKSNDPEYPEVYEIVEYRQEFIDTKGIIEQVTMRIIDKNNKLLAKSYKYDGFFAEKKEDVKELGLWLKPYNYCIKYSDVTIHDRSMAIACLDSLYLESPPSETMTAPTPDNFRKLCYNVFGVKTTDEYFRLLSIVSKSLQRTRGAQYFISVKGKGGSGKSTFVNLMCNIFKGLICEVTEEAFSTRIQAYDFIIEKRKMSRASTILIDESSERQKDNNLIKRITSGTSIPYRELSTNGGTIGICASVIYFSNNNIIINEIDSGTLRRMIEYESPFETIEIEWDRNTNFLDVFLKERNGIISDFIKSFQYSPKIQNKIEKQVIKTSYSDIIDMIRFEAGNIITVEEFNDKVRRTFGGISAMQKKLLNNELERLGVKKGNVRLPDTGKVHYCYINLDWALENLEFNC